MNQQSQSLSPARSRKCAVYRMVLAAMFACLAFVLNTFVYFLPWPRSSTSLM